jgi:hypothetical protein
VLYRTGNIQLLGDVGKNLDYLASHTHLITTIKKDTEQYKEYVTLRDGTCDNSMRDVYKFINNDIVNNINNLLLDGQRSETHAMIGDVLEEIYFINNKEKIFYIMLYHYNKSNNYNKKYQYLNECIVKSKKSNDYNLIVTCCIDLIYMFTNKSIIELINSACYTPFQQSLYIRFLRFINHIPNDSRISMLTREQTIMNINNVNDNNHHLRWLEHGDMHNKIELNELTKQFHVTINHIILWLIYYGVAKYM